MKKVYFIIGAFLLGGIFLLTMGGDISQKASHSQSYYEDRGIRLAKHNSYGKLEQCLEACERSENEIAKEMCEQGCFAAEAKKRNDISICEEKLTHEYLKAACIIDVAIKTKNPDLCKKLYPSRMCFVTLASATGDLSVCEMIKDEKLMYETCKQNVLAKQ